MYEQQGQKMKKAVSVNLIGPETNTKRPQHQQWNIGLKQEWPERLLKRRVQYIERATRLFFAAQQNKRSAQQMHFTIRNCMKNSGRAGFEGDQ